MSSTTLKDDITHDPWLISRLVSRAKAVSCYNKNRHELVLIILSLETNYGPAIPVHSGVGIAYGYSFDIADNILPFNICASTGKLKSRHSMHLPLNVLDDSKIDVST